MLFIMETILQAARDLIKFKIVASIDTGDKTYDNLIVLFIVSSFTFLFSTESVKNLYVMFKTYYYRDLKDLATAEYLSEKLNSCPYEFIPVDKNRTIKLIMYVKDYCCRFYKSEYIYVDETSKSLVIKADGIEYVVNNVTAGTLYTRFHGLFVTNKICPIFISKFGAVGLKTVSNGSICFMHLSYESEKALSEFKAFIEKNIIIKQEESKVQSQNHSMYLYRYSQSTSSYEMMDVYQIYPDRSFDNIISKHKKTVLSHLKQFSDANSGKSIFNGFGSYNLGIMIYGLPGTGKTSFMKALCNHVGRDGYVYDMKTVKTNSQFRSMFQGIKNKVYIFDEFDCIQGVINREHNDETQVTNNDYKQELKDKLLSLLSIQHKESKETQNITKEIEAVKSELKQLDEALNLETLLTVLDGPFEMRNRIIVAATNYIDRIDPALLRPGRFDLKIKLEEFDNEETIELLEKMFAGDDYLKYIKNHKFKQLTPTNIINICHEFQELKRVVKAISLGTDRSPCYCDE